jgi:DNA primase
MLSTKTIDQVRDLPIEQVIEKYTQLKRSGSSFKAPCPLPDHKEKTPSFHVSIAKNIFKCFGCGAGGDAIEFVMRMDNLPFIEAVTSIAQQHGIEIEEKEGKGKTPEQRNEEQEMLHIIHQANVRYTSILNQP